MIEKISFLKNDLSAHIAAIPEQAQPKWGKMTVQHMTEHMAREGFGWARGKVAHTLHTPEEHVAKMQAFILTDKPFRENTPNALMGAELPELMYASQSEALQYLNSEISDFFTAFEAQPEMTVLNPFFGQLDFALSIHLLYKHSVHHLKQFGVAI